MNKLSISPGHLYICKPSSSTLQQIVWLGINYNLDVLINPKKEELEASLSLDWNAPRHVLSILENNKKTGGVPPGYSLNIAPETTGFIFDISNSASNAIDNCTIFELDLSDLNCLEFEAINEAYINFENREKAANLLKAFSKYPSTLYHLLKTDLVYNNIDISKQSFLFEEYLFALTNDQIKDLWFNMSTSQAMRLFASDSLNFINFLLKFPTSGQSGLACFLTPFVDNFKATNKVEFIHDFARWAYASRVYWAEGYSRGACEFSPPTGKKYFYCSFSSKSLEMWAKIVKDMRI